MVAGDFKVRQTVGCYCYSCEWFALGKRCLCFEPYPAQRWVSHANWPNRAALLYHRHHDGDMIPDLFHEADWSTRIDHLQSDHLPLHIVLGEADPGLAETDRSPKYQYQRANWDLFESVLNEHCRTVDPRDACLYT